MLWYKVPQKVYFKRGAVEFALQELKGRKKAFVVTDRYMFNSGQCNKVIKILNNLKIGHEIFFDVKPEPTVSTFIEAYKMITPYEPDVIIALGGGSTIDTAKILRLKYEIPDINFKNISINFKEIGENINSLPDFEAKSQLVAIPTTSGTGSEVTPFAFIIDDNTNEKYAMADYALTPSMAIIDPNFADSMPKGLAASSGMNALVHALEAYTSPMATDYTDSNAIEAIRMTFRYLPQSYKEGAKNPKAREKMHHTSTIAGMAFANAFIGICHLMSNGLSSVFHIPYGIANALLIRQIVKYNSKNDTATQFRHPNCKERYVQIANELGLSANTDDEKVDMLINEITKLIKDINLPNSIKDFGVREKDFDSKLDEMIKLNFEELAKKSSPNSPKLDDIKNIYKDAYLGKI